MTRIMHMLQAIPYRGWLLLCVAVGIAITAIGVKHPDDFVWEHVLTAIGVGVLLMLEWRRRPLSNVAYTLIFVYLVLHIVGAHYTYSEVPYDDWARRVFGRSVSEMFGQEHPRNHFDRLVHLVVGVLLVHPIRELVERWFRCTVTQAIVIAGLIVIVLGTWYELLEWIYAMVVGAEAAERYNGQQGDMFDAQKDMMLNVLGTCVGAIVSAAIGRTHQRAVQQE